MAWLLSHFYRYSCSIDWHRPVYLMWDWLIGDALVKKQNECKPVVLFSMRNVKAEDIERYRREFSKHATEVQEAEGTGVRAYFSCIDSDRHNSFEKEDTVIEFVWLDSPDDFDFVSSEPSSLDQLYSSGGTVVVFGGWNEALREKMAENTAGKGMTIEWSKKTFGFMREPLLDYKKGFKTGEAPMIWVSKRRIKRGKLEQMANFFQKGASRMFATAPGLLAAAEFPSLQEEDTMWSLRVYNSFRLGFVSHLPILSPLMFRMAFTFFPFHSYFPVGYSFSTREGIEGSIAANPSNRQYTSFIWGVDMNGPRPDFSKGF